LVVDNANVSINVAVADLHAPIIDVSAHEAHASIVPGKDVVLCVDVSGSMGPAMASVRDTVMKVFEVLSAVDRVGIVTFSTTVATPLPLTEVSSMTRQDMQSVVNTLVATLSTNLSGGNVVLMSSSCREPV
jgi:Mg-chelatase subunit ChlD